jgi:hypothetical protein
MGRLGVNGVYTGAGESGHEAEFGDDNTDEEREDDVVVEVVEVVVIGCRGTARRPSGG